MYLPIVMHWNLLIICFLEMQCLLLNILLKLTCSMANIFSHSAMAAVQKLMATFYQFIKILPSESTLITNQLSKVCLWLLSFVQVSAYKTKKKDQILKCMFLFIFPNSWETNNSFLVKKSIIVPFFIKVLIYSEYDKLLPDIVLHFPKQHRLNGLKLCVPSNYSSLIKPNFM